jgi:8-oxo-dGTP pyrophosphatase MutT (NUDIX family)
MARQRKSGRLVASVALVVRADRKMAAMRAVSRSGRLSLLGGNVEPGEDPAAAAIREGEEESGGSIRISRVRLMGVWPAERGAGSVAGYLATKWTADPVLLASGEGLALWVARSDLLSPVDSAFPAWTAKLLEAYDAWLRLPPRPGPWPVS